MISWNSITLNSSSLVLRKDKTICQFKSQMDENGLRVKRFSEYHTYFLYIFLDLQRIYSPNEAKIVSALLDERTKLRGIDEKLCNMSIRPHAIFWLKGFMRLQPPRGRGTYSFNYWTERIKPTKATWHCHAFHSSSLSFFAVLALSIRLCQFKPFTEINHYSTGA